MAGSDKPLPLMTLTGGNLEGAKLDGILMFPAGLKAAFATWRVSATGIDDKEVRVLQGTNPRQPPMNFYFDASQGCSCECCDLVDTAVGRVPTQIDYSDYRDVAGVKIALQVDRDMDQWSIHCRTDRGAAESNN